MADMISRLKLESGEFDSKIARATKGLLTMEKECREVGGTLAILEKDQLEFVKGLGQMETVSQNAKGKIAELTSAFTELSVQYNRLADEEKSGDFGTALAASLDQLKIRIQDSKAELSGVEAQLSGVTDTSANAGNAMTSVFEGFAQKLGVPMNALKQLSSQGFAGVAKSAASAGKAIMTGLGPIGAVVAAIVLAVKQLVEAFKRNEDAMTAVQKIAAPFKAVWQSIQRLFDDIVRVFVDVYNNLEKAAGGFDGFKMALAPLAAVIAAIRAQFAIVGTILTDLAKGVAFVSSKVREAMSGSKVGSFFKNITDTVQGFFTTFTSWVEKIANSTLGKKLGLDSLYTQLKEIVNAQDELTESNKRIAESENELLKLRRQNTVANARAEQEIAKLREQASEKDKYNASERVKMLEQAAQLEEDIMKRNVDQKQRELDLIKLKNSLTQSGTEDLNAEADAEAALIQAETEFYNKKRALQRQLQSARNEDAGGGTTTIGGEEATYAEDSITAQEEKVKELTKLWHDASAELRGGYKKQLDEAQAVLDQMTGKTNGVAVQAASEPTGPSMSNFEKLQQSIRIKLADDASAIDTTSLNNLLSVAIQNGIDSLNPDFEELMYKMGEGFDIPDEAWENLTAEINEKLAELGIKPIEIDVKTGGVKDLDDEVEKTTDHVAGAAQAFSALGNAMNQIDDPGAKVAGMIAEAIGSVAAGYGAATAQAATLGPWAWIAFAITGLATMVSTIEGIKQATAGSYAEGGLIGGNSFSGDNLTANVNSGELILNRAQQGAIASQLQGSAQQTVVVQGRISGKDILLSANNTNRAAGGSRGYYTKVH